MDPLAVSVYGAEQALPSVELELELADELCKKSISQGQRVYWCFSMFSSSGLTNIDLLRSFLHLRYVDLSKNELDDVSALGWLDHLLTVRVDFNRLSGSIVMLERCYLQVASFANNRLTSCDGAAHPMLDHLSLNSIASRYLTLFSALEIVIKCTSGTNDIKDAVMHAFIESVTVYL